jgi:hypothetical protein
MDRIASHIDNGSRPNQASAMIWGSSALMAVTAGLWLVEEPVAQAALIVIAVSAPRAILAWMARRDQTGLGGISRELRAWPALRPPA